MNIAASAGRGDGAPRSDALVVFSFTGDLASKKISALYEMVKKATLTVPVIGVASSSLDAAS